MAEPPAVRIESEFQVGAFIGKTERIGILHPPGLTDYMPLRKKLLKPAIWHHIGRKINTVSVPRGQKKSVTVYFNAVEYDAGLERLIGMKDEYGAATGTILLDCCSDEILAQDVQLDLSQGGSGGGTLEIGFFAKRACA